MGKKDNKEKKPQKQEETTNKRSSRGKLTSAERKSERLTAAHVATRLEQVRDELADLMYEFRYLDRYGEITTMAFVANYIDDVLKKCDRYAGGGAWESSCDD